MARAQATKKKRLAATRSGSGRPSKPGKAAPKPKGTAAPKGTETPKGSATPKGSSTPKGATKPAAGDTTGLRVRMYRVGFGDFFLVTVPTATGPKHILIDCGVHAGNIGSIGDAVKSMSEETGSELALVIMTHRHADHISGFATCKDLFGGFTVERVWMSWFEDPSNAKAARFQAALTAVAVQVHAALTARGAPGDVQFAHMVENITGTPTGLVGGASNQVALGVLHGGFKNRPPVDYYQAGDEPTLPADLAAAGLTAQILGPPIDPTLVAQMDNKSHQYLALTELVTTEVGPAFTGAFQTNADSYPREAFFPDSPDEVEAMVTRLQPEVLSAVAQQADNTLNNQSLVVLFGFRGKTLLFSGDAQWGNWANFLFGGTVSGPGPAKLLDRSRQILSSVDFYKVGHHGSTNATPVDALEALRDGCVAMCSTEPGQYGSQAKGSEVPRLPLLAALDQKTEHQLVRSDQIKTAGKAPTAGLPPPPQVFEVPTGELFIDYHFVV
jgi:beta-lactamase superfamily II metal-dependent hydrolase